MAWFVDGELIDDAAVREEASLMRPQYLASIGDMDPIESEIQLRDWARENVIERMLLRAAAFADTDAVPPEIIAQGLAAMRTEAGGQAGCGTRTEDADLQAQVETRYRVEKLLQRVQTDVPMPKPKELADIYKRNKDRFAAPDLVHAAHIVKNVDEQNDEGSARQAIESALAELEAGAPFPDVANRYSDCAGNGGDLGWFPRGEMVDEFDNVVFRMPIGSRSEVFRSPFGFHIATVLGRKAAGIRPFKDVESEIAAMLLQERRQKAVEDYLDALRAKAEVRQGKPGQ